MGDSNTFINHRFTYWLFIIGVVLTSLFLFIPSVVNAQASQPDDIDEDYEEGDIKQHDMFEFEAFIKHGDVKFGTAPFDDNDEAGNDSSDDNGIVRTWDTVTYPLKITVNPKKADMLRNIKLRISGTLENGMTDDRVNGKFAVGGKEDRNTKEVSFVQEYTIERTGNSIMIPITVEVQGAKHGTKLRPDMQVEVVSVDGERINGVVTHFDELPSATVSAKVNIKPYIRSGMTDAGYPYFPHSKMITGGSDFTGVQEFSVSWGIEKLAGKPDIRGSTFPDSDGEINYTIELYGEVYWDNLPHKKGTERFNFDGRDVDFELFDHRPVSTNRNSVGQELTLMEGKSYSFSQTNRSNTARSFLANYNQSTINSRWFDSVWDSGDWYLTDKERRSDKIIYKGSNTDYFIGSTFPTHRGALAQDRTRTFGVDDKLFSTHSFLIDVQNEYRVGGKNNPNNWTNNVIYRMRVTLDDYVDSDGNKTTFNKSGTLSTTIRNGTGSLSAYGTFQLYPSGYTSPKNPYNWTTSVGDASILIGQDVNFTPRINPAVNLYGGYKAAYRWNTDAFELTKSYASMAERNIFARGYRNLAFDWVTYDYDNQDVYYGVAKFDDNSFRNFTSKDIDDYEWYETFDEAVQHGPVGAMLSDIHAPIGGIKGSGLNIPLRVKHENIGFGSETKDGTPVIAVVNAHAFLDEKRDVMINVTGNRSYNNYSKWDSNGNLLQIQSPVGGSVNFESLGIVPAKTSTVINSDKNSYYNSETIKWSVNNSIVLPELGVPDNVDSGITLKQTLPRGLDYKTGSGRVDGSPSDPEVIQNSDGSKVLVWNLLVSNANHTIPSVTYETTINPFALSSGVQSSLTVTSEVESELDGRPIASRSDSKTVTVLKVGMVGIYQSIDATHGDKNSSYTVTLSPYTTIEDELDVAGLTHLPSNDDDLGSAFDGEVTLTDIGLDINRQHDNETVDIYLNHDYVYNDKPNRIDVSKDGWYLYTGDPDELQGAKSIYFIVNGLMTNRDDIQIHLTVQTSNNNFGNEYLSETVINSSIDYNLSPISNRVRYEIRPDWELELERVQIFTNKKDRGLPVRVRVSQNVLVDDPATISDYEFDLSVYDTSTSNRVASAKIKQSDFPSRNLEVDMLIEADKLTSIDRGDSRNYEVRIENYNDDRVWAKEPKIDTDGYVATEKVFTNSDISDGKVNYNAVSMTERTLGQDMVKAYERFTISDLDIYTTPQVTKAGYGYQFAGTVEYENPMYSQTNNRYKHHFGEDNGLKVATDVDFITVNELLDETIAYYNEDGSTPTVNPNTITESHANHFKTTYEMDKIYIKRGSGETYTASQVGDSPSSLEYIDSSMIADVTYRYKNVLYAPIWSETEVTHDIGFVATDVLGANHVTFGFDGEVEVEASMFNHIDSDTPNKDEIMLHQNRNE